MTTPAALPATPPPRLLVHGPRLADPNELLFFDAWLWPTVQTGIRSRLSPGRAQLIADAWPADRLDALRAAGRSVPLSDLTTAVVVEAMGNVTDWLPAAATDPTQGLPSFSAAAAVGAIVADTLVAPLASPASAAELRDWLGRIDAASWSIAQRLAALGRRTAAKLHLGEIAQVLAPGWETTVALVLPEVPRIDHAFATRLPALLAFLADAETRRRREALYAWPAALAGAGMPLSSVAGQVAEAARDYVAWIEHAGLARGRGGAVELLWKLDEPAMAADLARPVGPTPDRQWMPLQRRGLAHGVLAPARSDTPLAWVAKRPRGYPG